MSDIITLKLSIDGVFQESTMVSWITQRAKLLNLSGSINFQNATLIKLTVSGERVLVDAFQVACSLGPVNALVNSITQSEIQTPMSFYRQQRQFI